MHVAIAALWGINAWLAALALAVVAGSGFGRVLLLGPVIVSGVSLGLLLASNVLSAAARRLRRDAYNPGHDRDRRQPLA